MPDDPESISRKRATKLLKPANDNGRAQELQANVLIPKDFPITKIEIEIFALLLDDLRALAANDNEDAS